ncbi:hypothetical protein [Dehalobacter restrictus]|nr:hypothetical protein [Dehalobacter restrictus]
MLAEKMNKLYVLLVQYSIEAMHHSTDGSVFWDVDSENLRFKD